MADNGGHARSDLSDDSFVQSVDFFELLRRLETAELRFGRAGGPSREPARLCQPLRLTFAKSDVVSVTQESDPHKMPQIKTNVVGLFGPEGPMPLHISRWMIERASSRWFSGNDANVSADTAFLDFANILQHRMIAFFWRTWADTRPEVQVAHGDGGMVVAMVRALAGVGLTDPGTSATERASAKLRHATSLFMRVRSPDRLAEYVASAIGETVSIREFVGVWTDIPKHLQTRLGQNASQLGRDTVVGARFFERANRVAIRVGPLDLAAYMTFLDDLTRMEELRHALLFAMGYGMQFDVILALRSEDVPEPRLGGVRLGEVSWLGQPPGDVAEDKVFRRLTEYFPYQGGLVA